MLERREFLKITGGTILALSLSPLLESCRSVPETANFNFLKEKGVSNLNTQETLKMAGELQKSVGETVRSNGRWLEKLTLGQITLKENSQYLADQITSISIGETPKILGKANLATTVFKPNLGSNTLNVDITIHPKVLQGSNEVIGLVLAKELQNIEAAARSAKEHQALLINTHSEADFWQFITSGKPHSQEAAIVLIDGRAYWETLDDFRQVIASLGTSYEALEPQDQQLLDSWGRLATFAITNGLIVENNGRWIQNPKFSSPGYIHKNWADYLMSLYQN